VSLNGNQNHNEPTLKLTAWWRDKKFTNDCFKNCANGEKL